jgi:hypothetical protein
MNRLFLLWGSENINVGQPLMSFLDSCQPHCRKMPAIERMKMQAIAGCIRLNGYICGAAIFDFTLRARNIPPDLTLKNSF